MPRSRSRAADAAAVMRGARAAGVLLLAALAAGCYSYRSVPVESVAPNTAVRAHLSADGARRVEADLGTYRQVVDGQIVRSTTQAVHLLVPSTRVQQGVHARELYQEVILPPSAIDLLQRRQLDRARTGALAIGGAAVVGAVLVRSLSGETGSSGTSPGPGGPPEVRIPLFSLLLR